MPPPKSAPPRRREKLRQSKRKRASSLSSSMGRRKRATRFIHFGSDSLSGNGSDDEEAEESNSNNRNQENARSEANNAVAHNEVIMIDSSDEENIENSSTNQSARKESMSVLSSRRSRRKRGAAKSCGETKGETNKARAGVSTLIDSLQETESKPPANAGASSEATGSLSQNTLPTTLVASPSKRSVKAAPTTPETRRARKDRLSSKQTESSSSKCRKRSQAARDTPTRLSSSRKQANSLGAKMTCASRTSPQKPRASLSSRTPLFTQLKNLAKNAPMHTGTSVGRQEKGSAAKDSPSATKTMQAATMSACLTRPQAVKDATKLGKSKSALSPQDQASPKRPLRTRHTNVASDKTSLHQAVRGTPTKSPPTKKARNSLDSQSRQQWHQAKTDRLSSPPVQDSLCSASTSSSTDASEQSAAMIETLKNHCWSCHTSLQANDDHCFYAMHTHPVLEIPTCSVCSEICYNVEANVMAEEEAECCSGCGRGDDDDDVVLLLCDSCPRAFCLTCVSQANGGGSKGGQIANNLANDDFEWKCLCCSAPTDLVTLQQALIRVGESDVNTEQEPLETLKEKLLSVEEELERCDAMDNEQFREMKRAEIRTEVAAACRNDVELEETVNAEMELLERQWRDHHARVAEHVTTLQEQFEARLKNDCGISLLDFYKSIKHAETPAQEEAWRIKADAEMDKRYKEEDAEWEKYRIPGNATGTDKEIYEKDDLDEAGEIEDINTVKECMSAMKERDGNYTQRGNKKESVEYRMRGLQKALRFEDMLLTEMNIAVKQRNEGDDEAELQSLQRSAISKGGRVRRDALLLKRTSAAARKRSNRTFDRSSITEQKSGFSARNSVTPRDADSNRAKKRITPLLLSPGNGKSMPETATQVARGGGYDVFDDSDLILTPAGADRTISVAAALVEKLKKHQFEGIKFMWNNTCRDLSFIEQKDRKEEKHGGVGGCILAHHMGLGKSLQTISLLHALLCNPSLVLSTKHCRARMIRTALLVVPTNTLKNWEDEFDKWVGDMQPPIHVVNLNCIEPRSRARTIKDWHTRGGVLLVTNNVFSNSLKNEFADVTVTKALQTPGPDIVILDEAHTMIRNSSTHIYKALKAIQTKRRIALTGTPLQNNLAEYFHMASWVRPGCLGSESSFERLFVQPIKNGMNSDSSQVAVEAQRKKSRELHAILSPFVHRRDNSALKKELPFMQQVVIHVRQSMLQHSLYLSFSRHKKKNKIPFLEAYNKLVPVHNHPGCLLMRRDAERVKGRKSSRRSQKKPHSQGELKQSDEKSTTIAEHNPSLCKIQDEGRRKRALSKESVDFVSDSDNEVIQTSDESLLDNRPEWWERVAQKKGENQMKDVQNGNKVALLLNILADADELGDKVVVFSKCLKTLDFIGTVLESPWESRGNVCGPWRKNSEYLRIDGDVGASERGNLVSTFNGRKDLRSTPASVDKSKVFLISIEAGGVGINLIAANRVVLFDSHWNPAVMSQALHRCYRFGQTKPVFAYRFITEGSMEEKIYSRSVNKSSLAARVIDQQQFERLFTEKELDVLLEPYLWSQCDDCNKWRMLPPDVSEHDLPDKWFCHMNDDEGHSTCDAEERSQEWYAEYYANTEVQSASVSIGAPAYSMTDEAKRDFVKRDKVLCRLLGDADLDAGSEKLGKKGRRGKNMISKYYFHDVLLEDRSSDPEREKIADETDDTGPRVEVGGLKGSATETCAKLQSPGEPTASPMRAVQGLEDGTDTTGAREKHRNEQKQPPNENSVLSPKLNAKVETSTLDSSLEDEEQKESDDFSDKETLLSRNDETLDKEGRSNEYAIEILSDSETG